MRNGNPAAPGSRSALLVLPLITLLAVLPLLWNGCSCGHDFDFHILNWMEAATQFQHGNPHPQWAFTPAFNAGEPRFVFYPPVSWTLGAMLGLAMPWGITPIVYTWLALTAAGLCCYRLLREFAPPQTALLIAALYSVNPYMLFTAYERTAYAELLAAAWLPLLLLGGLRKKVTVFGVALPVALLWLTNAPAAVIGCYGLAVLTTMRLLGERGQKRDGVSLGPVLAANIVGGTTLGLGLAAFYIVPAAYERRYVQIAMAVTDGMRIADNYLFHRTPDPDHDVVLHTASLLAVGLLIIMALALFVALVRRERDGVEARRTLVSFAVLTVMLALLLTPLSAPIWRHAPELAFLQFPWRLLALLMPMLAVTLTLALRSVRLTHQQMLPVGFVLATLLTFAGYRGFRQGCDAEDTVAARLALFHSATGTEPTDEYTPLTADNDALHKENPPFWLAAEASAAAPANDAAGPLHWPVDVISPQPQTLILNLRDYPAWRVRINHQLMMTRLPRADGLLAIPIAAGRSHLDIAYAQGADQRAGWIITILSFVVLALMLLRRRTRR